MASRSPTEVICTTPTLACDVADTEGDDMARRRTAVRDLTVAAAAAAIGSEAAKEAKAMPSQ